MASTWRCWEVWSQRLGIMGLLHLVTNSYRLDVNRVLVRFPPGASGTPDEAADDPPSEGEVATEGRGRPGGAHQLTSALPVEAGRQDVEQGEIPAKAGMKPPPFNAVISGEVEMHGPSPSAPSHVNVPSTPVIHVGRDDLELEASERPAKQARTRDVMAVEEKHEDEMLEFHFQDAEVEMLEEYDETLEGHDFESYEAAELPGDGMKDLIFPYTAQEPELGIEEMSKLDIIADMIEVERLKDMGVLISMDANNIEEMKSLSTRFVRTWRDKIYDNSRVWLRRSRLVAREYFWLADRSDLFSPASNAISGRLLQLMFLRQRDEGYLLSAIDVADAFLTVKQREKTKVTLDSGVFELGKVLPGQRAGSQWWYEDLTSVLCAELQMKQCEEYPNLLCNDDRTCMVLLHVDDMLVCGRKDYVLNKFVSTLQKHYKISASYLQDVGDELTFLKRTHRLLADGRLAIAPHPRHIEQLMKLTGIKATSKPKRVPGHAAIDEADNSEKLDDVEASEYRSAVGILLYLAIDLPHAQHAIRHLSTGMSSPSKQLKDILRHLVSFLFGTKDLQLRLDFAELMNFCNLGYIVGSTFAPFSEHVQETKQVVALIKSLKKDNSTIAGIIQASLIQNALSRCSAMSVDEVAMDGTSGITIGYVEYFNGYCSGILFMTFEVHAWQLILLFCMVVFAALWMIHEIRGYKASLASWSSLTDSMLQDDLEERREAFVSYMRWKRQQADRSRWFPRIILGYFGSGSENSGEDFGRSRVEQHGIGGDPTDAGGVCNSGTQTDLEAPSLESSSNDSESDSTRRERYRHLSMDETSNPDFMETWMQITWMLMGKARFLARLVSLMSNLILILITMICTVQGTEPFEGMNDFDKKQLTETI